MDSFLLTLRQNTQMTPEAFLRTQPGCFIQYYDDTPAKDPSKALSAAIFDPETAKRKQEERCAVCFSLQEFKGSRTKDHLLSYRNFGVDVDLVPTPERRSISEAEIEQRKDDYLVRHLRRFSMCPHWLIETQHGFHAVFRVTPVSEPARIAEAEALNRRLVAILRGDPNAALLTQCLRVPGTYQFKDPMHPFLCRLLLDFSSVIPPHDLARVRTLLDAHEVFHDHPGTEKRQASHPASRVEAPKAGWRDVVAGVPEGRRNAAAAAIVGSILCRLPQELWDTAGWGGLLEWNRRNLLPLPERELRAVFESIVKRERSKRGRGQGNRQGPLERLGPHARPEPSPTNTSTIPPQHNAKR